MKLELLKDFFMWCTIVNLIMFMISIILIVLIKNFASNMHAKWYGIKAEKVKTAWYSVMAFYKIMIIIFNFVPYLVLEIMI